MLSPNLPTEVLESYDHIELTEEEIDLALRQAREQKHFLERRIAYRNKVASSLMVPSFTAEQMLKAYAAKMQIDDDNRYIVEQVAYYFAEDSRFKGDLKKGLWLYGSVGVGKTALMKFFFKNQKQSFIVESCRTVEAHFAKDGDFGMDAFCRERRASTSTSDPFGHQVLGFCFDDLGTEPVVTKYYGTDKSVMTEVILNRYDAALPFIQTHITTNLSAEQIRQRYGSRAADRMREMFNFLEYTSTKSRRVKEAI